MDALSTYHTLNNTNSALQSTIKKLSTGLRINSAADDAAGLAISEKMRAQYTGLEKASSNAQDGISMLQTAEGALNETHSLLQRMRELSVQAANDTLTQQDRSYIQKEIDQYRDEITRIGNTTQFNKKKLLNGDAAVLWSSSDNSTKAVVKGGLRSLDQFGQKVISEGNYRIKVKANAGVVETQKSDIFKIKHANVMNNVSVNPSLGVAGTSIDNVTSGKYKVDQVAASDAQALRVTGASDVKLPDASSPTQTAGRIMKFSKIDAFVDEQGSVSTTAPTGDWYAIFSTSAREDVYVKLDQAPADYEAATLTTAVMNAFNSQAQVDDRLDGQMKAIDGKTDQVELISQDPALSFKGLAIGDPDDNQLVKSLTTVDMSEAVAATACNAPTLSKSKAYDLQLTNSDGDNVALTATFDDAIVTALNAAGHQITGGELMHALEAATIDGPDMPAGLTFKTDTGANTATKLYIFDDAGESYTIDTKNSGLFKQQAIMRSDAIAIKDLNPYLGGADGLTPTGATGTFGFSLTDKNGNTIAGCDDIKVDLTATENDVDKIMTKVADSISKLTDGDGVVIFDHVKWDDTSSKLEFAGDNASNGMKLSGAHTSPNRLGLIGGKAKQYSAATVTIPTGNGDTEAVINPVLCSNATTPPAGSDIQGKKFVVDDVEFALAASISATTVTGDVVYEEIAKSINAGTGVTAPADQKKYAATWDSSTSTLKIVNRDGSDTLACELKAAGDSELFNPQNYVSDTAVAVTTAGTVPSGTMATGTWAATNMSSVLASGVPGNGDKYVVSVVDETGASPTGYANLVVTSTGTTFDGLLGDIVTAINGVASHKVSAIAAASGKLFITDGAKTYTLGPGASTGISGCKGSLVGNGLKFANTSFTAGNLDQSVLAPSASFADLSSDATHTATFKFGGATCTISNADIKTAFPSGGGGSAALVATAVAKAITAGGTYVATKSGSDLVIQKADGSAMTGNEKFEYIATSGDVLGLFKDADTASGLTGTADTPTAVAALATGVTLNGFASDVAAGGTFGFSVTDNTGGSIGDALDAITVQLNAGDTQAAKKIAKAITDAGAGLTNKVFAYAVDANGKQDDNGTSIVIVQQNASTGALTINHKLGASFDPSKCATQNQPVMDGLLWGGSSVGGSIDLSGLKESDINRSGTTFSIETGATDKDFTASGTITNKSSAIDAMVKGINASAAVSNVKWNASRGTGANADKIFVWQTGTSAAAITSTNRIQRTALASGVRAGSAADTNIIKFGTASVSGKTQNAGTVAAKKAGGEYFKNIDFTTNSKSDGSGNTVAQVAPKLESVAKASGPTKFDKMSASAKKTTLNDWTKAKELPTAITFSAAGADDLTISNFYKVDERDDNGVATKVSQITDPADMSKVDMVTTIQSAIMGLASGPARSNVGNMLQTQWRFDANGDGTGTLKTTGTDEITVSCDSTDEAFKLKDASDGGFNPLDGIIDFTDENGVNSTFGQNSSILFEVVDATDDTVTLKAVASHLDKNGQNYTTNEDNIVLRKNVTTTLDDTHELFKLPDSAKIDGTNSLLMTLADPSALQIGTKFVIGGMAASDSGDNNAYIKVSGEQDKSDPTNYIDANSTGVTTQAAFFNLDATKVAGKEVSLKEYFLNSKTGEVKEGSVKLKLSDGSDGLPTFAAGKTGNLASFDAAYIGKVASADTKLRDLDKFWTSEGTFMLEDPKTITINQGNGNSAAVTLYANDTLRDVANKFNDAIGTGLGQASYVDNDGNGTHFCDYVDADYVQAGNNSESVEGTFVLRSVTPGADGTLRLAGDESLINALSLNTIQEAKESTYTVSVNDAHTGNVKASNVSISGNKLIGVIHDNVDVTFDAMSGLTASWSEANRAYRFNSVDAETTLHLADNSTVFQIGANEGEDMGVDIGDMRSTALGLDKVLVTDRASAARSITLIDNAIDKVSTQRATIGAYQNRLEHTITSLNTANENLTSAESRIRDTDMAKEMMNFTKLQIMLQAGTSMLAQANQSQQTVLSLMG